MSASDFRRLVNRRQTDAAGFLYDRQVWSRWASPIDHSGVYTDRWVEERCDVRWRAQLRIRSPEESPSTHLCNDNVIASDTQGVYWYWPSAYSRPLFKGRHIRSKQLRETIALFKQV